MNNLRRTVLNPAKAFLRGKITDSGIALEKEKQVDSKGWDLLLIENNGNYTQSNVWMTVFKEMNWKTISIIFEKEKGPIALLRIYVKKIPVVSSTVLFVPFGPVFISNGKEDINAVLESMINLAKSIRSIMMRVRFPLEANIDAEFLEKMGFIRAKENNSYTVNFRIDLRISEDEILKNMEYRTRYGIRTAMKRGITVEKDNTESGFERFYELHSDAVKRAGGKPSGYKYMKTVWRVLNEKKMADIFFSKYQDNIKSGAFVVNFGAQCWYAWGGSKRMEKGLNVGEILHWEIIRWAKSNGMKVYNLGGVDKVPKNGEKSEGIYLFKKGLTKDIEQLPGEWEYWLFPKMKKYLGRFLK